MVKPIAYLRAAASGGRVLASHNYYHINIKQTEARTELFASVGTEWEFGAVEMSRAEKESLLDKSKPINLTEGRFVVVSVQSAQISPPIVKNWLIAEGPEYAM